MIGKKILTLRKTLGLNQEEFAKSLHVSGAALCKIEKGLTKHPRGQVFQRLLLEYNVNLNWLYSDQESMFKN